jgi:hypothetical protein
MYIVSIYYVEEKERVESEHNRASPQADWLNIVEVHITNKKPFKM